jgi:hypothetical protein
MRLPNSKMLVPSWTRSEDVVIFVEIQFNPFALRINAGSVHVRTAFYTDIRDHIRSCHLAEQAH